MPNNRLSATRFLEIERATVRRQLRLEASALLPSDVAAIVIHNLSETGLLIESTAAIDIGTRLQVHIPGQPVSNAVVVWGCENSYGCQFEEPLTRAAVSATLLSAPPEPKDAGAAADLANHSLQSILAEPYVSEEAIERWPLRRRAIVIIGSTTILWALIGAVIALLI